MMQAGDCFMCEYMFHCDDCGKEFTQTLHMVDREKETKVTCPNCGSQRVGQLVTTFSALTDKKS